MFHVNSLIDAWFQWEFDSEKDVSLETGLEGDCGNCTLPLVYVAIPTDRRVAPMHLQRKYNQFYGCLYSVFFFIEGPPDGFERFQTGFEGFRTDFEGFLTDFQREVYHNGHSSIRPFAWSWSLFFWISQSKKHSDA